MSYDQRCHVLAQVFLSDAMPPSDRAFRLTDELAQEIQDTIEAFMGREVPHTLSRACWCQPKVVTP
jgi:hypothetical protein